MKRWVLHVGAWMSRLACISLIGMLVWSIWWMDSISCTYVVHSPTGVLQYQRRTGISSNRGSIQLMSTTIDFSGKHLATGPATWTWESTHRPVYSHSVQGFIANQFWFSWDHGQNVSSSGVVNHSYVLNFPFWHLIILFALIPLLCKRQFLRYRKRLGLCLNCGYDLRASPERCPECGKVPELLVPSPGTPGQG